MANATGRNDDSLIYGVKVVKQNFKKNLLKMRKINFACFFSLL